MMTESKRQDPVSLGELRRLWRRLPKNFEARVLQHLVLEARCREGGRPLLDAPP